jgi:hypothetical protein
MLDAPDENKTWRIPFALNDPLGEWRVTATDVVSGKSSTGTIRLGARSTGSASD